MTLANLLADWSWLLLDSMVAAGVADVVISPGSRSTPFVVAAATHPSLRCHDAIDERAAAFFALGQARATGRASLLVCTSGTAGAHYYAAVVEAASAYVPLLVLTADRPFELMGCGAPQTIDQTRLYGHHVRGFFELGMPDPSSESLRALRRTVFQAAHLTSWPVPGPVHLNARARKPLEPRAPTTDVESALHDRTRSIAASPCAPRAFRPSMMPDHDAIDQLVRSCLATERGIIACGPAPLAQAAVRNRVSQLSCLTGYPLIAEAASQLRFAGKCPPSAQTGARNCSGVPSASTPAAQHRSRETLERTDSLECDGYDVFLRSSRFRASTPPELVIQLGAPLTSSNFEAYLREHTDCARWVIAPYGWNDPSSSATIVHADTKETLDALVPGVKQASLPT
ncbi:MAG: 2-succinyl-5-enolpyruvyl-6-hydroxy-3-cyclohexene-1-carboxylic-acid synthase, partial [Pseudomonadota bacterium]